MFLKSNKMFIKFTINNSKIILGCIPSDAKIEMYSKHCDGIESIYVDCPHYYFIVSDDFNLSGYNWFVNPNIKHHVLGNILCNLFKFEVKFSPLYRSHC